MGGFRPLYVNLVFVCFCLIATGAPRTWPPHAGTHTSHHVGFVYRSRGYYEFCDHLAVGRCTCPKCTKPHSPKWRIIISQGSRSTVWMTVMHAYTQPPVKEKWTGLGWWTHAPRWALNANAEDSFLEYGPLSVQNHDGEMINLIRGPVITSSKSLLVLNLSAAPCQLCLPTRFANC